MPQMMPINWMFLFFYFMLIFFLFMLLIYFTLLPQINNYNNNMKNFSTKSFHWKW